MDLRTLLSNSIYYSLLTNLKSFLSFLLLNVGPITAFEKYFVVYTFKCSLRVVFEEIRPTAMYGIEFIVTLGYRLLCMLSTLSLYLRRLLSLLRLMILYDN